MTVQELAADAQSAALRLALERAAAGDWLPAAEWLVARLNDIDGVLTAPLDAASRVTRRDRIDHHVGLVGGDWRDIDEIRLADGTRIRWRMGRTRSATRWFVEARPFVSR